MSLSWADYGDIPQLLQLEISNARTRYQSSMGAKARDKNLFHFPVSFAYCSLRFFCNHHSYNNINDSQFSQMDLLRSSAFPFLSYLHFGHFIAFEGREQQRVEAKFKLTILTPCWQSQ